MKRVKQAFDPHGILNPGKIFPGVARPAGDASADRVARRRLPQAAGRLYWPHAHNVAVIGASSNRQKFGNKALRAFRDRGYTVVPINPKEPEVEGETSYASVLDVPGPIDMANVLRGAVGGTADPGRRGEEGDPEVWLNPGADGPQVVERAQALGLKTVVACSILGVGASPARVLTRARWSASGDEAECPELVE